MQEKRLYKRSVKVREIQTSANLEYNIKARDFSIDLNMSINKQIDKEKEVERQR